MKVLFSKPPQSEAVEWNDYTEDSNWNWPEIKRDEIREAIFSSSTKKAAARSSRWPSGNAGRGD